ncbi:MAG TPA: hypothetical protein VL728_17540 [Cyclobacteriaceae bacterium]|nr:hypothetical protein [Cyclobacteriaceae bacterium]
MKSSAIKRRKDADLCILLIREELKSRKFFSHLHQAGLEGSIYQTDLNEAILTLLGITDPTNEVYDFYHRLMEKHSTELTPEEKDMTLKAKVVWRKLMMVRG